MQSAPKSAHRFPEATHTLLEQQDGAVFVQEKGREELWISQGLDEETNGNYENWLCLSPMDDNFGLEVNGATLVPARLSHFQIDARGKVKKALGIGKQKEKRVVMTRDMEGEGQYTYVERIPGPIKNAVLLSSRNGEKTNEDILPSSDTAALTRLGTANILELGRREPAYFEQTVLSDDGTRTLETKVVDNRSRIGESGSYPLTADIRSHLERFGKIVYESDPRGTDRLVICLKHIHGRVGDGVMFSSFENATPNSFQRHQKNMCDSMVGILDLVGKERTRLFLETFPFSFSALPVSEQKKLLGMDGAIDKFFTEGESASRKQVLERFGNRWKKNPQKMMDVLQIFSEPMSKGHILTECARRNCLDLLYGDGRPGELYNRIIELADMAEKRLRSSPFAIGMVGVASDQASMQGERMQLVLEASQRGVIEQMAKTVQAGNVAVLEYGGGHFSSGIQHSQTSIGVLFEEYLRFLPRTQFVVVQVNDYAETQAAYAGLYGALKRQPIQFQKKFHNLRESLNENMQFLTVLILFSEGTDPVNREKAQNMLQQLLDVIADLEKTLHGLLAELRQYKGESN